MMFRICLEDVNDLCFQDESQVSRNLVNLAHRFSHQRRDAGSLIAGRQMKCSGRDPCV